MDATLKHLGELAEADQERCEQIARAFEGAWQQHPQRPPDIAAFLPAEGPLHFAALVQLMCIDLEMRLKQNKPPRVEDYLRLFTELERAPQAVCTLIAWVFQQRLPPSRLRTAHLPCNNVFSACCIYLGGGPRWRTNWP
jgi:hypothetical protein